MNLIRALYCNQYYELKSKGKEDNAQLSGTILATVALLLNFFTMVFLLVVIFPDFGDYLADMIEDIFGRRSGRSIGRFLAIVPMALIYLIVRFTVGNDENFNQTTAEFEALSEDEQKVISKTGLIYFLLSIGVFVVSLVIFLIVDKTC